MKFRLFLTIGLLGLLSACGSSSPRLAGEPELTSKRTPEGLLQVERFDSCEAFKDYYAQSLAQEIFTAYAVSRSCFGCDPAITLDQAFAEGDSPSAAPSADTSDRQVTQTNTQEAGIDEADLIETNPNGNEIYLLRRQARELLVIDTSDTANLQIISRTALAQDREPRGLYFDEANQRLAIIQTPYYPIYYLEGAPGVTDVAIAAPAASSKQAIAPYGDFEQGTKVLFFDVSNPAQIQLIESFESDGQYVSSRRIGDRLHLITQFGLPYPAALYQDQAFSQAAYQQYPDAVARADEPRIASLQQQISEQIRDAVAAMPITDLLPASGTLASGQATLSCQDLLRPEVNTRMGLIQISSIDTDGSGLARLASINNAWQMYASSEALYLLQSSGGWWFDRAQTQQTAIYRFDIASGTALPGAVGLIDGWVGNSYQLSEFEGHLRVSSTEGRFRDRNQRFAQANHLSVLDTDSMTLVGEIRDFVPLSVDPERLETIRATRFIGPRGFVVTFEQTDPLFAFDLSQPSAPRLSGQLEIPGFSSYIYPLSDDHLLTIGRAGGADGSGVGRAYQLQLFDVSPAFDADTRDNAPQLLASAAPALSDSAYAYSTAEHEPLAFTFLVTRSATTVFDTPPQGLLSIPAQISSADSNEALSGFVAYQIEVNGENSRIDEYTRIDHKDLPSSGGDGCPPNRDELPPEGCSGFAPVIYNEPLRSVIIKESGLSGLAERISLLTYSEARLIATDASADQAQSLDELKLDP